jgi:hypothetical protein
LLGLDIKLTNTEKQNWTEKDAKPISRPNIYKSISSTRLEKIAFDHQIPRVSFVRCFSLCRYQDDSDKESYSGVEEDMSGSFRQEKSILDIYSEYREENEREWIVMKYNSISLIVNSAL